MTNVSLSSIIYTRILEVIMDFRQLEVFMAVVELSSFSRAGEKLYLSQPTVSAHINSLEKELNTALLIRNTREVYASEAGQLLYSYAAKMLNLRDEAIEAVGDRRGLEKGTINIAASSIPANYLLPTIISGFRREFPNISFNIIPCDSARVCETISEGHAKLGIGGAKMNKDSFHHYAISTDKLVLISPDNDYFRAKKQSEETFSELLREPFICRPQGSGTRYEFEQYLARQGYKTALNVVAEMADTEAIKNSVAQGMGVAVISERAAAEAERFGQLRVFPLPGDSERYLYLVRRKRDRLSERERVFYGYVLSKYQLIK